MINIIDRIESIATETKKYAEAKYESVRLESIEKSVEASSTIITWFVIGVFGFISLILITILGGIALSEWTGSYLSGFGIITLIYLFVLGILFYFRSKLITENIKDFLYGFFIK